MPSLADIYSFIDTQKRKAGNLIRSPISTLQEMVALSNDEARDINRETALASQGMRRKLVFGQPPTPEQAAADESLNQRLINSMNIGGMTVWHGSPYKFTKFDPAKIGTGEGQQVYGHGLYVAENPNVAAEFKDKLNFRNFSKIVEKGRNDYDVIAPDGTVLAKGVWYGDARKAKDAFDTEQKGNLYKIDLPDKHIEKMLDYDEEIKNQPRAVRELAKKLGVAMDDLGFDLLQKVGRDKAGSDALQAAGIPGIKYFDQMKREEGKKTRNFVVFDPNHLQILEHK